MSRTDYQKFKSMKKAKIIDAVWSNALLIFLCLIWIIPILWVIASSFRGESTGLITQSFFPKIFTPLNYIKLFKEGTLLKYKMWLINTFLLAAANCVGTTLITLCTAYTLARFRFKMRKPFMNIALILGMFPGFMAMSAIYLILQMVQIGGAAVLLGNTWALLLIYMSGAGLGFFTAKGYFDTLPVSLDESAYIDGASRFKIFYRIILPLARPIIVYCALTAFMAPWGDYVLARLILGSDKSGNSWTVAVGLYNLTIDENIASHFTTFAAGCTLIAIPIVALYMSLQKFMIEGIAAGAVKG